MANIDVNKLIAHLKSKWQGRSCPMCGTGNWNVSDKVYELREYHGGALIIGETPIVPVVPITCDNCGNTILINAIVAGILEQKKEGKDEK